MACVQAWKSRSIVKLPLTLRAHSSYAAAAGSTAVAASIPATKTRLCIFSRNETCFISSSGRYVPTDSATYAFTIAECDKKKRSLFNSFHFGDKVKKPVPQTLRGELAQT